MDGREDLTYTRQTDNHVILIDLNSRWTLNVLHH